MMDMVMMTLAGFILPWVIEKLVIWVVQSRRAAKAQEDARAEYEYDAEMRAHHKHLAEFARRGWEDYKMQRRVQ